MEPEGWYAHHMRFSNSVVMMVCFGRRTEKGDGFLKEILEQFAPVLKAMRPGIPPRKNHTYTVYFTFVSLLLQLAMRD